MVLNPKLAGIAATIAALVLDQANKLWLIFGFGIESRQPVRLAPFFDIIFAKNTGISYSLFRAQNDGQRYALILFTLAITLSLSIWLWRSQSLIVSISLGLIIGGALGNGIDRVAYGFVADFYHFHIGTFSWYVFNLADVAIVAGVGLLLYDSLFPTAPRTGAKRMPGR
jgi:signal peptidase II